MLVGRSMGPAIVGSSLEVMLDALRQKDDKPKDTIPALPVRPVSRGRLPSSRRPLPANFNIENNEIGIISKKEVGSQEESVDQSIQVICIQKHVRGVKARRDFQELRKGVISLQSFIRGSLARKHFDNVRSLNVSEKNSAKLMDAYREHLREAQETVQELQDQVLKAEAALKDKDEENNTLKQQIQQYESKWSEYDMKMKSMEETWSQRLTSLQISLAEAKRSIAVNEKLENQQASHNSTPTNNNCDTSHKHASTAESLKIRRKRWSLWGGNKPGPDPVLAVRPHWAGRKGREAGGQGGRWAAVGFRSVHLIC